MNSRSILNLSVDELVDFIEPQIVIDEDRDVDWAPNTDCVMGFNNEILARMETAAQDKGDWDQVKKVAAVLAQAEKALSKMREAINTINRGLFKSIADRQ